MSEATLPPGYPIAWEADVVLRDGSVAFVRPIKPSDQDGLQSFHAKQSDESIYLRFFAPLKRLSENDLHRFTHLDYVDRVALVATLAEEIIGIGRYDRIDQHSAEVAFNISDNFQGKGIGSVLLEHLAAIARDFGIAKFTAEVLPQNRKMLTVFSEAGYVVARRVEDGVVAVSFDIEPTEQSKAVAMAREHRAEAISVRRILTPRSIAVIGASRRTGSIGRLLLENIIGGGFTGEVYPVNPAAEEVHGLPAYPSVSEVPLTVDLAVVAVPARECPAVIDECARAGVGALLVVSSGFAETGEEGADRQLEMLRAARGSGMRVVGPNSFGFINTDPNLRLNASLSPNLPPAGHLGLFAQSGALGIAVLASALHRGLGITTFASAGNRVDVSGNDIMQFFIDDDRTAAVGLYIESMGNPRKFFRVARNLATTKPVIVIKSGVSAYGVPPGHRVRQTKARPEVFSSMLRQSGVIRVEDVHQLFDVAQLVVNQPLPKGRQVAIVGNSGALSVLMADACLSRGLEVAHGPVSIRTEATAAEFREALDAAFADDGVDSVLSCFVPPQHTVDADVAEALREAARGSGKPCTATFLGMRGVDDGHRSVTGPGPEDSENIPVYSMPEDAVRALAAATNYGEWRAQDRGTDVAPAGINRRVAEHLVHTLLGEAPEGRKLSAAEVGVLLGSYGISTWPKYAVDDVEAAVVAAEKVGYPVVLKSVAPMLRHQGGVSGVRIDLASEAAVRDAWDSLTERLAPLGADDLVVQRMATPGVPCVVTSEEDPLFGPVLGFGVAGISTDLLGDVAYRIPPLTDVVVSEMISSVKAAPLLNGHRGAAPVDRAALADLIARVSVLADDMPEIASLVINPVNAHAGGVEVLDAEITVEPTPRRTDPGRRSLT